MVDEVYNQKFQVLYICNISTVHKNKLEIPSIGDVYERKWMLLVLEFPSHFVHGS